MAARRLLALAALLLLGLAAAAPLLLPRWLDAEGRRAAIAAIASERLGRTVAFEGPVTLRLLPEPSIAASGLVIGEAEDEIRMAARGLRMRLDLRALLLGRIALRELVLVGADIRLPWPPTNLPGLVPPPWLTALNAQIEDSRIAVGGAEIEGVTARLTAGGATEALLAEGRLTWRGRPMRFQAALGRAADDGVGALDFLGEAEGATVRARGALLPQGGFDGRFEAAGPSLAALMPAPALPFRAAAELRAGAERLVARNLALELGPPGPEAQSVRGSATLALLPEPDFRLALAAPRMEVEPWLAALRGAGAPAIPIGIEFAVEQSRLGPLALRRLAGTVRLAGPRLALNGITAELLGGAEVHLAGGGEGERLELTLRGRAQEPERLAEALGWPAALLPPPGVAEGQARLVVEGPRFSVSGLEGRWGEAEARGGFVWRAGARPSLALGLELERLSLPAGAAAVSDALRAAGQGVELQLRLGVGRLDLAGALVERLALDAAAEPQRLVVRRLAGRYLGLDLALTGTLAGQRLHELALEGSGAAGPLLAALGLEGSGLGALPLRVNVTGGGALEALALRLEAELAEARVEAQGTLDLLREAAQGTLSVRHPGAARLLGALWGTAPPEWVGPGSLSLVAALAHRPGHWSAENFDLVAGGLRGRGQLALGLAGPRPALSGRFAAEALPLPPALPAPGVPPLDLDVALTAERLGGAGWPALEGFAGRLGADAGGWRLAEARARLGGGAAQLSAGLDAAGTARATGALEGVALPGPLLDRPLDLTAGRLTGRFRLAGPPGDPARWAGEADLALRDGLLQGFDAARAAAAIARDGAPEAEAALRTAFAGGATAVEAGRVVLEIEGGVARIREGALTAEGGLALDLSGSVTLPGEALALRLAFPTPGDAPPVALELGGTAAAPEPRADIADFLAWRSRNPP
jgi:hypothetical protein